LSKSAENGFGAALRAVSGRRAPFSLPHSGTLSRGTGLGVCDAGHRCFVMIAGVKGPAQAKLGWGTRRNLAIYALLMHILAGKCMGMEFSSQFVYPKLCREQPPRTRLDFAPRQRNGRWRPRQGAVMGLLHADPLPDSGAELRSAWAGEGARPTRATPSTSCTRRTRPGNDRCLVLTGSTAWTGAACLGRLRGFGFSFLSIARST
jgi:hypothetical protein